MTTFFHLKSRLVDGHGSHKMRKWKVFFWNYDRLFSPKQICLFWWAAQFIQSLCPLRRAPCWVYWALKLLKIYRDESASRRKGVVKIDTRNSIPSWWWCFTSPFTESTRWLSILALLLTAPHHPPPRADAELFSLRFWSQADSASFLWKDEMSACQKAKVPRTAITEIWRAPKFKSNVMLVHWA